MNEKNMQRSAIGPIFNMIIAFLGVYAAAMAVTYLGWDIPSYLSTPPYWGWWLEAALYGLFTFWFYGLDFHPIRQLFSWPQGNGRKSILQWVLVAAFLSLIISVLRYVLSLESVQFAPIGEFDGVAIAFQVLALCVVIPLGEELIFRGYLQEKLISIKGPKKAIIITSVLFGLLHVGLVRMIGIRIFAIFHQSNLMEYGGLINLFSDPIEVAVQTMIYAGVSGVLFGYLAWRYHSLWPAIIAHATYNLMGVLKVNTVTVERLLVGHLGMQETALFPYIVLAGSGSVFFYLIRRIKI